MLEGPGADSEEKREPASDINTPVVDSLKVLDPERPIREADMGPFPTMSFLTHLDISAGSFAVVQNIAPPMSAVW